MAWSFAIPSFKRSYVASGRCIIVPVHFAGSIGSRYCTGRSWTLALSGFCRQWSLQENVSVPLTGSIDSRQMAWSFTSRRPTWVLSTVVVAKMCLFVCSSNEKHRFEASGLVVRGSSPKYVRSSHKKYPFDETNALVFPQSPHYVGSVDSGRCEKVSVHLTVSVVSRQVARSIQDPRKKGVRSGSNNRRQRYVIRRRSFKGEVKLRNRPYKKEK